MLDRRSARGHIGHGAHEPFDVPEDGDLLLARELADQLDLVVVDVLGVALEPRHHDRHVAGGGGTQDAAHSRVRDHGVRPPEVLEHLRKGHEGNRASDAAWRLREAVLHDEIVRRQHVERADELIERLLMRAHGHEDQRDSPSRAGRRRAD